MRTLDETDIRILSLLMKDARQPYSDIAQEVELSPPAVSDRIDRLQESGVIRRFTVDIDRSKLRTGVSVFVTVSIRPDVLEDVRSTLRAADSVEHVFTTAGSELLFTARFESTSIRESVLELLDGDEIEGYDVRLLSDTEWVPTVGGTEFALTCAECGNTVTEEGVVTRIDGTVYHFCCPSCEQRFTEAYEELQSRATE